MRKTVLVIDDDTNELSILKYVLGNAGYKVLLAEDGDIGLQRAIFAKPDLILLDALMPGLSGLEVCEQLRENNRTHDIPIIFRTCLSDERTKIDGFKAGMDDFVTKPYDHLELITRIEYLIGRPRLSLVTSLLRDASLLQLSI